MNAEIQAVVAARGLDAEITVPRGTTLAVLGPNGAGKSSLLAVAAGLLRPDRGRVVVGDRTLTSIGSGRRVQVPTHARGAALLLADDPAGALRWLRGAESRWQAGPVASLPVPSPSGWPAG